MSTNWNKITLLELDWFWSKLKQSQNIGDWKENVRVFRDEHELTDQQAINLANKKFD